MNSASDKNIEAVQRGAILDLVRARHRAQRSRYEHVALTRDMQACRHDVGEHQVLTLIQEMCDAEYVTCHQERNRYTNQAEISMIALTHKGRQLLDGHIKDPMVYV